MALYTIIRRLTRFLHCQRSVVYFFIFVAIFVIYYFYSNPNEELEFLRTQFDLHISKLHQLEKKLNDANNKLHNSEMECRTNLEALYRQKNQISRINGDNSNFRMIQPHININTNNNHNFGQFAEQQPKRGDIIPNEGRKGNRMNIKEGEGQREGDYPKLTIDGNFLPNKLWVHFDFKGAPLKPSYFLNLLPFLKKIGINGILLEWEDQFPYSGQLANAVNGEAYSKEEVEQMLGKANELGIEIIPLVQTFGHLEWILKLKEFSHLREDPRYPQVICFGSSQSWELLTEMIKQVAEVHKRFGMNYFHIGADEVFQLGGCNESIKEIRRQGGREKAILWHISRTAAFLKEKYSVTVLAWHDMLIQSIDRELMAYKLPDVLEPVLWSYAEDLDAYLPYSNWISLKPFKNVWGSSAFKGADGPMRISTNSLHYIRNHESWIEQMTRIYREFDRFQGLIITGWSRYDHLAVLCELWPVAIPTLAMATETILAGKPMNNFYEKTNELLQCNAPLNPGYAFGCKFPGSRIYELVNEFAAHSEQFRKYAETDFDFNGWVSVLAEKWNSSSPMYIKKVLPYIDFYLQPMERIERELRIEMPKYFRVETTDEFIFIYMSEDLELLRRRKAASMAIMDSGTFPRRPFINYKTRQYSSKDEHSISHF